MSLPEFVIERHGDFYVCRDDLLDGGTKRRALLRYLPKLNATHFFYAGTVFGSGGWALAEACLDLGFRCTLFLSDHSYKPAWTEKFSAHIKWQAPNTVEHIHAQIIQAAQTDDALALPLGFDDPDFKACMVKVLKDIEMNQSEIWMPCVSGTLVNAAQTAWQEISINAVCVAKHHGDLGTARKHQAAEKYHQPAKEPPPYPANKFTDAKLWSFVRQFALKDALIWNTSA